MSDQKQTVPFFVHEAEMERHVRIHRRDFVEKIILIILLVATNFAWLWYESQFETYETYEEVMQEVTQEADDSSSNMFVGGDYYGKTDGAYDNENNY